MYIDEQAVRPAHPSALPASAPGTADTLDGVDLEALFRDYGACCQALARGVLRDENLAQDVVQEAFLDHWRGASFDATRGTRRHWLLMLTHRRAVDRARYEQRRVCSTFEVAPEQESARRGPEDVALARVLAVTVRQALGTLPRVQQEALTLAYWGGYTQREIADITRAPLGTVKTRTRNGMISLREVLRDQCD